MRIGVDLGLPAAGQWPAWRDAAVAADRSGLDGVLVRGSDEHDALVLAASLAYETRDVHVVAVVPVGLHALHLAERISVADQALAGRLVVALDVGDDAGLARETLEVLERALADRPFRHVGVRWRVPGGLHGPELPQDFRLTPPPAALELPIWLTGEGAAAIAQPSSRIWLPRVGEDGASFWAAVDGGGRTRPAQRRAVRTATGWVIADTVSGLRREAGEWGLSFALLSVSQANEVVSVADVERIARAVRPRVQLSALPAGLDRFWDETGIDD